MGTHDGGARRHANSALNTGVQGGVQGKRSAAGKTSWNDRSGRDIPRDSNIVAVHSALIRGELFASPAPLYQYGIGVGSDSPHSHMPSDFAESTILAQAGQRTHRALMRQGIQTPVVPPEASSGPKNLCIAN